MSTETQVSQDATITPAENTEETTLTTTPEQDSDAELQKMLDDAKAKQNAENTDKDEVAPSNEKSDSTTQSQTVDADGIDPAAEIAKAAESTDPLTALQQQFEGSAEKTSEQVYQEVLRDFELAKNAAAQFDPKADLPAITHEGVSIYDMSEAQFNAYLTALQDDARFTSYEEAVSSRRDFVNKVKAKEQYTQGLVQYEMQVEQVRQTAEWDFVEAEFTSKVPELKEYTQQVGQVINAEIQRNPDFYNSTLTAHGKKQAVHAALKALGVYEALAKKQALQAKTPSVPDAGVKSNVAKSTGEKRQWTQKSIEALSTAEYAKHSEEILKAMANGEIK